MVCTWNEGSAVKTYYIYDEEITDSYKAARDFTTMVEVNDLGDVIMWDEEKAHHLFFLEDEIVPLMEILREIAKHRGLSSEPTGYNLVGPPPRV